MPEPETKPEPALDPMFNLLAQLVIALGDAPLNKRPGAWIRKLDGDGDNWWVALNGHAHAIEVPLDPEESGNWGPMQTVTLEPFTALVYYNGWPAGIIGPYVHNGVFAAGEGANPERFAAAIQRAMP